MRALGYVRVSSAEQAKGGSLATQRQAIYGEIQRRNWELVDVVMDAASGKDTRRPGLTALLARLRASEADALVVARLDRLSRSTADFYDLLDLANKEGWSIVVMDPAVDMTSPFGRAMAGMAAVFGQLERELNSQRQKDSYARRKLEPDYQPNSPRARPQVGLETVERMKELRAKKYGLRRIANQLLLEGHYPPRAERWDPSTIRRVLQRERNHR